MSKLWQGNTCQSVVMVMNIMLLSKLHLREQLPHEVEHCCEIFVAFVTAQLELELECKGNWLESDKQCQLHYKNFKRNSRKPKDNGGDDYKYICFNDC